MLTTSVRGLVITLALLTTFIAVAGCEHPSRNAYGYSEVGKSSAVSFGTILAVRDIDIIGKNTGSGALVGAAAGGGAGSYAGGGSGTNWAIGAGIVAGAIAGGLAEQAMSDRKGIEYTVVLESGVTMTVPQELPKSETAIPVGTRVIVQNSGGYQRVLPATNLPTEVKRPQGLKVID
jgi:outer membrane lipoprotein SlyB